MSDEHNEENCAICLDSMEPDHTVTLGCSHHFHGQCLVTSMIVDIRCPLCRYVPVLDQSDSDDDRISMLDALRLARHDKTNKSTVRNNATIAKWAAIKREARVRLHAAQKNLRPSQRKLRHLILLSEKKLRSEFELTFAEQRYEEKEAAKTWQTASVRYCNAQMRLARKYGFTPDY